MIMFPLVYYHLKLKPHFHQSTFGIETIESLRKKVVITTRELALLEKRLQAER